MHLYNKHKPNSADVRSGKGAGLLPVLPHPIHLVVVGQGPTLLADVNGGF